MNFENFPIELKYGIKSRLVKDPRVNLGFFEGYIPISNNDIAGTNIGIGFRLGGFYLGSSSIFTALTSDSKQADVYTGFRFAFL